MKLSTVFMAGFIFLTFPLLIFADVKNQIISDYATFKERLAKPPLDKYEDFHKLGYDKQRLFVLRDEQIYQQFKQQILNPFRESILELKIDKLVELYHDRFETMQLNRKFIKLKQNMGHFEHYKWDERINRFITSKSKLLNQYKKYFRSFKKIDDFNIDIYEVRYIHKKNKLVGLGYWDFRGQHKTGYRWNDRMQVMFEAKRSAGKWKLNLMQAIQAESVTSKQTFFISSGEVPSLQQAKRTKLAGSGYALAVSDINDDGINDIFLGSAKKSLILEGKINGKFKPYKNSIIDKEKNVIRATFGDFNNSGREDLLCLTDNGEIFLFQNLGRKKYKKHILSKDKQNLSISIGDFNQDRLLDIYIGAKKQKLMINLGAFQFKNKAAEYFGSKQFNGEHSLPRGAVSADFDLDGDTDLIVLNHAPDLSPIYLNNGKGKFIQSAQNMGAGNWGAATSAELGDLDNDGKLDLGMTNLNFMASARMLRSGLLTHGIDPLSPGVIGMRLFKAEKRGNSLMYSEINKNAIASWTGEGLSDLLFFDYNNDGYLDIYLTNGLWSGNKRNQSLGSDYVRAAILGEKLNISELLQNYKGDLYQNKRPRNWTPSLAGFQRNRLFHNLGHGKFIEVGYLAGIDTLADGHAATTVDINNDGLMDLILSNAQGWSPQIYENKQSNKRLSVRIRLKAKKATAFGAILIASIGGKKLIRQLKPGQTHAQGERILHFGLNHYPKIDQLKIKWPSGKVENHFNLRAGLYFIQEGEASNLLSKL